MIERTKYLLPLLFLSLAVATVSCTTDDEDETTTTTSGRTTAQTGFVPEIDSINLNSVGTSGSAALQGDDEEDESCSHLENMGFFGIALGGACHSAGMAAEFLMGDAHATSGVAGDYNGDGTADCDDVTASDAAGDDDGGPGLMLHLLCNTYLASFPRTNSLLFGETSGAFGVNFAAVENDASITGKGTWTQGDSDASMPATITMYQGSATSSVAGFATVALESLSNGVLYLDMADVTGGQFDTFNGRIEFSAKEDTTDCATNITTDDCHYQNIQLYFGEGQIQGPPNGFRLEILADDDKEPTFLVLKGAYYWANGQQMGSSGTAATVAYKVVQNNTSGQLWGQFTFKDSDGVAMTGGPGGLFDTMASGICINLTSDGSSDPVTCTTTYEDVALFSTDATAPTSAVNTLTFPTAPTSQGICTLSTDDEETCTSF